MERINIISERFLLKPITANDATVRYLNWFQEESAKKFIAYAQQEHTLEELRVYIEDKTTKEDALFLGIFQKDKLFHIGNIKFEPIDSENHYAVMGILIGEKKWQGKGVAPEVIIASAMWLNSKKDIKQIILGVDANNKQAIKSYKKIGFVVKETSYLTMSKDDQLTMIWDL